MAKKDGEFWMSGTMNNATYLQYYNRLVELSVCMFEYENAPETFDPRFFELALFTDGKAIMFKDEVLGFLGLRCALGGQFDVYNVPMIRNAFASNGYHKQLGKDDSVVFWNNYLRTNSILNVRQYALRLYNLDRIIDVNANAQKTPILIACNENELLSMKNLYMKYDGNMPVIFGEKGINTNSFKVLNTGAPYVADRIQALKTELWNEALTFMGISNNNYTKKERMVAYEAAVSSGGTMANRYSRLAMREKGCEEFNRMFGTNMSVKYREDMNVEMEEKSDEKEGGEEE